MKNQTAFTLLAAGLLALSSPALGAGAPASAPQPAAMQPLPPDDPAKVAAARDFIKMFHPQTDPAAVGAMIDKSMPRMIAAAKMQDPKLDAKKFEHDTRARILQSTEKVLDLQAHVVSRHFTLQELNAFIAFFHTPAGQKLTAEQPKIQADMLKERRRQMVQGAVQLGKSNVDVKPSGPASAPATHK